jgi:hypothetical protein
MSETNREIRSFGDLNMVMNPLTQYITEHARDVETNYFCGAGGEDSYWFKAIVPGEKRAVKVAMYLMQVPNDATLHPAPPPPLPLPALEPPATGWGSLIGKK